MDERVSEHEAFLARRADRSVRLRKLLDILSIRMGAEDYIDREWDLDDFAKKCGFALVDRENGTP